MTDPTALQDMIGRTAVDPEGAKIGKIGQVYLDDDSPASRSGSPCHTGLFGTKESFAPLYGSRVEGDQLVLAVSKDLVKDAPNVDADGHTSDEENDALYRHYAGYLGATGDTAPARGTTASTVTDDIGGGRTGHVRAEHR